MKRSHDHDQDAGARARGFGLFDTQLLLLLAEAFIFREFLGNYHTIRTFLPIILIPPLFRGSTRGRGTIIVPNSQTFLWFLSMDTTESVLQRVLLAWVFHLVSTPMTYDMANILMIYIS